jgi:hypothetical protein
MSEIFINKCLNKIYLTSTDYKPIKTEINLILNQIINYQKNINLMLKNIRDTNIINISAEKLILTLRQDLKYHTELNQKFKNYFTEISKLGNNFKYNLECLNEHKKNLQFEMKDFVEIVEEKEKEMNDLKEEKNMLILTNEALLNDNLSYFFICSFSLSIISLLIISNSPDNSLILVFVFVNFSLENAKFLIASFN